MMRGSGKVALIALALGGASTLSGCIAAVAAVPIAAAGAIGRKQISGSEARRAELAAPKPTPTPAPAVAALVVPSAPAPVAPPPPPPPPPAAPNPGMQYLYGSGEAAALSIQAYQSLWNFLSARVTERKAGTQVRSVVLAKDGTLEAPKFVPCGKKQLAVVFDVDETVLLNLRYE
jgi:hypothetical protein